MARTDTDWAVLGDVWRAGGLEPVPEEVRTAVRRFLVLFLRTGAARFAPVEQKTAASEERAALLDQWRQADDGTARAGARDIVTAIAAAGMAGGGAIGVLTLSVGPVQSFIAAARSLRDLWTGSALLSWLSFQALRPVIERLGPWAVVFPALRGNPLVDLWLEREVGLIGGTVPVPSADAMMVPNLPHRSLAIVPWGPNGAAARELARACEDAARKALEKVAEKVRTAIDGAHGQDHAGWDGLWSAQIKEMLRVQVVAVPLDPSADQLERLKIGTGSEPWPAVTDLAGRVLAAARAVRLVPVSATTAEAGAVPKCSLLGTWEQMGGDIVNKVNAFWDAAPERLRMDGVRIRKGERFCAPSLVKRFAFPAVLGSELGLAQADARFPDTATVAAMEWLEAAELDWQAFANRGDWSGQWLHWRVRDQDKDEEPCPKDIFDAIHDARHRTDEGPPAYYAILAADGDRMGDTLRREATDPVAHGELSARIGAFAAGDVGRIVREHKGVTIYAGGDDVLAVLPTRRALMCGQRLRNAFKARVGPGLSVGVAVVHHKADLRDARDAARDAEKAAKGAGRDRLALTIRRRSGEHATSLLKWDDVAWADRLVEAFRNGASDRWAYRLRQLAEPLDGMKEADARIAELKRQIGRAETDTLQKLADHLPAGAPTDPDDPVKDRAKRAMVAAFGSFHAGRDDPPRRAPPDPDPVLHDFAMLCQAASFLARARD